MDSTLKNIRSKTYDYVTNPTYMSYILIGLSTVILGYYTVFDKGDKPAEGTEESSEAPVPSEETKEESTDVNSMFGGPAEQPQEEQAAEQPQEEPVAEQPQEEPVAEQPQEEEKKEEPTIGGKKKKKTRRDRKHAKKSAKKSRKHN